MARAGVGSRRRRRARLLSAAAYYVRESSIHGVRYLADPGRHWVERVFWAGVCTGAIACTYLLLMASWHAFQNDAVSFVTETAYLDWNTSFPAVSVCEIESPDKLFESATKVFGEKRNRNLDFFLRDIVFYDGSCRSCTMQCGVSIECREDFTNLIKMVRASCADLMFNCRWNGQPFDCCKNFLPLQTETGLCFTINSIHNRYHLNGTHDKDRVELISNRKTGPGTLEFMARESIKIFLHAPEDVPSFNHPQEEKEALFWGLTFNMRFSVTEIENDPQLLDVSVAQRNCRLPHENPLKLHNKYSYSTCIVECHARYQMELCNCTHHYMPNAHGIKVNTCNVTGLSCLNTHAEELRSLKTEWSNKPGMACDCVSSCTEPEYSILWKSSQSNDGDQDSAEQPGTRVRLMMSALPSTRFRRNVVRTKLDLVVSMGGTAGLFLGASLLTLVEVAYYTYNTGCKPSPAEEGAAEPSVGSGSGSGSGSVKRVQVAPGPSTNTSPGPIGLLLAPVPVPVPAHTLPPPPPPLPASGPTGRAAASAAAKAARGTGTGTGTESTASATHHLHI